MMSLERLAYIAHGKTLAYQKRLERTVNLILKHKDYGVSTSWGKDSMVLLHIAAQIHKDLKVINARYPNPNERLADMDRVRDLMLARTDMSHIHYHEVQTAGEWEMYERAGGGFAEAINKEQRSVTRWWKEQFETNMGQALESLGCRGIMLGLRAEESHARRMNIYTHGESYMRKDGKSICLPLSFWSAKDIWAYMFTHDLPYLKIYDIAHHGRETARSGFVFATGGAGAIKRHGVWEDWRRCYPTEFNAWLTHFPELEK